MVRYMIRFFEQVVVLATVLAFVSIGFAHHSEQPEMTADMQAYVDAGGSLSDICGLTGGDHPTMPADCEACRISDNLTEEDLGTHTWVSVTYKFLTYSFVAKKLAQSQGLDPARLTRAPPIA